MYASCPDPVPVSVMKIYTSPWGTGEPMTTPETCRVEFFWQAMPGETQTEIDRQFHEWFDGMVSAAPNLFRSRPQVEFPLRWLPGSAISEKEALITELSECARETIGKVPVVAGIEGPCDMYVFHEFGIPAVLWGARGGNTHAADEYVELDSVTNAAKALLLFVCRWCGARG
jgi:acetylornithine deacetylase